MAGITSIIDEGVSIGPPLTKTPIQILAEVARITLFVHRVK